MPIRFSVESVHDLPSRAGPLASGLVLEGLPEAGVVLADEAGRSTTVLGVEFGNPQDRRTGRSTLELARTTPGPVTAGPVLTAVNDPAGRVSYEYFAIFGTGAGPRRRRD